MTEPAPNSLDLQRGPHRLQQMGRYDPGASHRSVTPLELLFDLAFVVAFGQAADQLTQHIIGDHVASGVVGFVYAILAIASVWVSFTWFTSAFGVDDWLYRVATMVQMIGVVVLALGLPAMFASLDSGGGVDAAGIIAGYLVMRAATLAQWIRLAAQDPSRRRSAVLHIVLVTGVLAGWSILWMTAPGMIWFFSSAAILFTAEVSGTRAVERQGGVVPWNARHLAERFGLLAIIALGEGVFGTLASVSALVERSGWSGEATTLVIAGMGLTFGLWWMYFLIPASDGLTRDRSKVQPYIYLHFLLYIAIVATGAGLHVAAFSVEGEAGTEPFTAVIAVAIPVATYCTTVVITYSYLRDTLDRLHVLLFAATAAVLLLAGALAATGAPLAVCLLVVTVAPLVSILGDQLSGPRSVLDDRPAIEHTRPALPSSSAGQLSGVLHHRRPVLSGDPSPNGTHPMVEIQNAVVLVTGANGGLGSEFVKQALERGAAKVYAAARTPRSWDDERIVPLLLDVTDGASVATAASSAADVTVVINNAGIYGASSLIDGPAEEIREQLETNLHGPLAVTRAFAPALRSAKGALVNIASVVSWLPIANAYSISKAALWSATNALRIDFAASGVHVLGAYLSFTNTGMSAEVRDDANDPADVVRAILTGLEAGEDEVLADETTRQVRAGLAAPIAQLLAAVGA